MLLESSYAVPTKSKSTKEGSTKKCSSRVFCSFYFESFIPHHTLFIVWSVTFPEFPMKRGAVLRPPICGFFFLSEIIMIDEIWNNSSRSEPDEPSTAWLCKLFCHPRVFGNNRTIVLSWSTFWNTGINGIIKNCASRFLLLLYKTKTFMKVNAYTRNLPMLLLRIFIGFQSSCRAIFHRAVR